MLYRPESEHSRKVEEYKAEFEKRGPGHSVELLDCDRPEAIHLARIYDITSYPAVLATRDDGQLLQSWQGEQLPLMNELAAFTL